MPIAALPATSVRALGSGQVLTDPVSLIKELIENSLDASATAISIEVSQNLLDILQVKDNGYGIPDEDRDVMAVRYCTSKIRGFSDIASCRTLGFRGEALASAAELSGALAITTRVEGEKIATMCTCDRAGSAVGRKNVSAPQGTTVRVTEFFKYLPVRRETALKNASRSMSRLRVLLQAYCISYTRCRFSLRVLASTQKGPKGKAEDIVYAPSKTVPEAVRKAVGNDIAGMCEWIDSSASYSSTAGEAVIKIEAFLPKPSADPSVITKKPLCAHFVYVDSRPVSCARGALKQILNLYKTYFKNSSPSPSPAALSDPFIYLNIRCDPGTYDPNIEPAKDDVLFNNSDEVITAVENIFKGFYGELKEDESAASKKGKGKVGGEMVKNGFEVLLARKPKEKPPPPSVAASLRKERTLEIDEDEEEIAAAEMDMVMSSEFTPMNKAAPSKVPERRMEGSIPLLGGQEPANQTEDNRTPNQPREHEQATQSVISEVADTAINPISSAQTNLLLRTLKRGNTKWGFNMYGGEEDDGDLAPMNGDDSGFIEGMDENEDIANAARDVTLSNPWTAAKMNAPITPIGSSPLSKSPTSTRQTPLRPVRSPFVPPLLKNTRGGESNASSSPPQPTFSRTPKNNTNTRGLQISSRSSSPESRRNGASSPESRRNGGRSRRLKGNEMTVSGSMDGWITRAPQSVPSSSNLPPPAVLRDRDAPEDNLQSYPAENQPLSVQARAGFVTAAKVYRETPQENYADDDDDDENDIVQPKQRPHQQRPKRRKTAHNLEVDLTVDTANNSEDLLLPPTVPRPTRSPHRNRFLKATAALSTASRPEKTPRILPPPPEDNYEDEDNDASLYSDDHIPIINTTTSAKKKQRRRTKSLLPLEIIPEQEWQTHGLTKKAAFTSIDTLQKSWQHLKVCGNDKYFEKHRLEGWRSGFTSEIPEDLMGANEFGEGLKMWLQVRAGELGMEETRRRVLGVEFEFVDNGGVESIRVMRAKGDF